MKTKRPKASCDARASAVYETMRLYHAWIGYLLTRLGERTVRVRVEDVRDAMDKFQCSVSREGDAYVIRLADPDADSHSEKEGCPDGDRDREDSRQDGEHSGD